MHTARHRTARLAMPPPDKETCACGKPGYARDGNTMCAPCRLASHHYSEHEHRAHARRYMCAHCQVCGTEAPEYTIAGLTWACRACASHIAGSMAPRPQLRPCYSTVTSRYGLDGRPLCVSCQDPSYAHYLTARAGIIVHETTLTFATTSTAPFRSTHTSNLRSSHSQACCH